MNDDDDNALWKGYLAALVACVAFGSFAVPIRRVGCTVDPLVLQTYKIYMNALCSMLLTVVFQQQQDKMTVTYISKWGILSGLFMVPGGTAGYVGVQRAGLAVSQGIWSCLKVVVAFLWGCLVFHEHIRSTWQAVLAIMILMVGLAGMSAHAGGGKTARAEASSDADSGFETVWNGSDDNAASLEEHLLLHDGSVSSLSGSFDIEGRSEDGAPTATLHKNASYYMGILGAIIDGAYGGSVLVPMHFAPTKGLDFVPSFASGCLLVVSLAWLVRWLFLVAVLGEDTTSWRRLSQSFVGPVVPYACLAGLIWSVGNIASVLAVAYLGQGVGYSLVQGNLLVAGLWGSLYLREITHQTRWLAFGSLTIAGIVLLSMQRG